METINDKLKEAVRNGFNEWCYKEGRFNSILDIKKIYDIIDVDMKGILISVDDKSVIHNDNEVAFLPLFTTENIGNLSLDIRIRFACDINTPCYLAKNLVLEIRKALYEIQRSKNEIECVTKICRTRD